MLAMGYSKAKQAAGLNVDTYFFARTFFIRTERVSEYLPPKNGKDCFD